MRPRRRRPEDAIQRAICRHLEARAAPGLVWFHVPQGNKRATSGGIRATEHFGAVLDLIARANNRRSDQ
jgi:hypothetical protein